MTVTTVACPLPGTFYRRPAPDQAPFKEIGDAVAVDRDRDGRRAGGGADAVVLGRADQHAAAGAEPAAAAAPPPRAA